MLFLPLLAAITVIDPGVGAKFLGWTADGHALVWTTSEDQYAEPSEDDPSGGMGEPAIDETISLAIVHDVRSGDRRVFILKYAAKTKAGQKTATLKKKYASAGTSAAFETWKKANPLSATPAKQAKNGTATVTVKLDAGGPAAWKGNAISWSVESKATVTLGTSCGKATNTEVIEQEMGAMYTPSWTAKPIWAPTGRQVAFLLEEALTKTMRGMDGGRMQLVLVGCGTRVEVVAPAELEASAGKVADAVEKAGYAVVSIGPAKAKRAATVIYATPAATKEAEALAKSIPGGATVDKLTWKPKADIVVAIGDSAK